MEARQRPRPDAGICDGEVSCQSPRRAIRCGRLSGSSVPLLPEVGEEQCGLWAASHLVTDRPLCGRLRSGSPDCEFVHVVEMKLPLRSMPSTAHGAARTERWLTFRETRPPSACFASATHGPIPSSWAPTRTGFGCRWSRV